MGKFRKMGFSRKLLIPMTILLLAVLLIGTVASATPDYRIEVPDRLGFDEETLTDGAIVQYIGDLNTSYGASGSGVFDPFVRLQGNEKKTAFESGYNTDGTREFDTKAGTWTHSILLSEIPIVEVGGNLYWEFWSDINDNDKTPLISLDEFELYLTDDSNLSGYDFGANATKFYDFRDGNGADAHILINDVNQGSGRGDLRYLVPVTDLGVDDCNYGNPACSSYLVLYSEWGGYDGAATYNGDGNYGFDGGFEEWKVKIYPKLQVSKTIFGSYDTPVTWDIDKEFDGEYDLFIGGSTSHDYQVSVDPIFGDPENTMVYGTITILGDEDDDVYATITDKFNGVDATSLSCDSTMFEGKYLIPAKGTVTCSYSLGLLGGPVDGTNVARASFSVDNVSLAFEGSADILATEYVETLTGDVDINVTDTNGEAWGPVHAASDMWTYSREFSCSADPADYNDGFYSYTHDNTATITETGQSDDATVVVNCYAPVLSKDAAGSYDERHEWDIDKSVSPTSQSGFAGDYLEWTWDVTLSEDFTEENFAVTGKIYVENPTGSPGNMDVSLVDQLNDGTFATVDCGGGATNIVVAPGFTEFCDYTASPAGRTATLNTATGTFNTINFVATHSVSFAKNVLNGTADVDDDQESDFPTTVNAGDGPWEWTETQSHTCSTNSNDYGLDGSYSDTRYNTATVDGSDGDHDEASAETTYTCYIWDVNKTADGFYQDRYDWDILKTVDPEDQTGGPGDELSWTWSITWWSFWVEEVNHAVSGVIMVDNPADMELTVGVADVLTGGFAAAVTCNDGDGGTALTIAAGGSGTCDYTAAPGSQLTQNTATATRNGVSVSDTVDVNWVQGPDIGLDAVVSDDGTGSIPSDSPQPFEYSDSHTCSSDIGDYGTDGTYSGYADNTAYITWTGGSDDSSAHTDYTCEAASLEVLKLTEGLQDPAAVWTFNLYMGSYSPGNLLESQSTPPALMQFQTALHLGTSYTICEIGIPYGWTSTWSDPSAYFAAADVKCVDFTPTLAGELISFTVDNNPPNEGCTPGWWKNQGVTAYDDPSDPLAQAVAAIVLQEFGNVIDGTTASLFEDAFDVAGNNQGLDPNLTLLGAIELGGGDFNALARHGTAALLNSLSVNYEFSPEYVLNSVHNAFVSGNIGTLLDDFSIANNRDHSSCPVE